ncbi:O-antigen ligase family protein [Actinoplanes sp. NPDC051859]|uniref:O-antigen ligase family protein n=1 Tax=Actinoplanes sp. NPDC051859 TaxID=3363909 RepID=UPI0037A57A2A
MAGLVLTAVIMSWDRVPQFESQAPFVSLVDTRGLAPQELIACLLLVQRGFVLAWDRFRKRGGTWPNAGLFAAFALPGVAAGIATLTAYNFTVAVMSSLVFCFALARGWMVAQYIREHELKLFENIILWLLVLMVVFGYAQFLGDVFGVSQRWTQLLPQYNSTTGAFPFPRVQSFALEPLYLGHWMFLPLGILLTRYWRTRKASAFEQILLVSTLGIFLLTLSRGAILGLLVTLPVLIIAGRSWRPVLYLARSGALALVIVAGMLFLTHTVQEARAPEAASPPPSSPSAPAASSGPTEAPPPKPDVVGKFTGHAIDLNDGSAQTRYELWPDTLRMFIDHPLTGIGPNNTRLLLHDGSATASPSEANKLQPVNNDYLAYLSELGLVGVLLALPLLWLVLRAMWGVARARLDHPASPYAFAVVGMAVEANNFQSFALLRTWVVVGLLLAGARIMSERQAQAESSEELADTVVLRTDSVGAKTP